MITFGQYYGTTEMDSRQFEGPIPEMIKQAEIYVLAAMCKAVLEEKLLAYIWGQRKLLAIYQ
jgi:hypothetical protein